MLEKLLDFLKKTYKVFSVIIFVIFFFVFYNTFLVERSLVNLRIALDKLALVQTPEDLQKIKPFLKLALLKEISQITTSSITLASVEFVVNVIDTAKNLEQVEEVRFFLKNLIAKEDQARGGFLAAIDKINSRILPPQIEIPKDRILKEVGAILSKIRDTKDKELMQNLYYQLGSNYLKLGDIPNTESVFLKAVAINPLSPIAIKAKFNLAWAYKSVKEYLKAVVYFEEVAKESVAEELPLLSQYQLADILYKKGEYKTASENLAQLATDYPQFSIADLALYEAAYISFYHLHDQQTAVSYILKLEEKFPKSKIIKHAKARFRSAMAQRFIIKGYRLLREKKYYEAIENFKKAIEFDSASGPAFAGIGLADYWLDMKQEAQEQIRKAINVSADNEVVLVNSLFVLINCNAIDEAIKVGEDALSRKVPIKHAEFRYNLGYAYIRKAQIEKANEQLKQTLRLNPDFIYAYNNLGCSFWTIRSYAEAIRKFKEALAREPKYLDAHFNLGMSYFYTSQFREAYNEFRIVLEIDPNNRDAQDYLRHVIKSLGYQP